MIAENGDTVSVGTVLRVFAILSLVVVVSLWKPISTGQWYAAGDVSGLSKITHPASGTAPKDLTQTDVTVDILPWLKFDSNQIRSGNLPLWNPYNNSGVPQLANIQAGVFSPFNVPFYVLPMRVALILSVALLLLTAGMLTYGLLRHLGASDVAGIISALAYMYCGYMVFWLRWPLASAGAFIPGIFWAVSSLVRSEERKSSIRRTAGLATLVALSVFAGHPETTFFGIILAAVWAIAWLVRHRIPLHTSVRRLLVLAGAGLLGLALSAVQLLPFIQYLSQSHTIEGRQVHVFQSFKWIAIHAFPLAFGSPVMEYTGPYNLFFEFHEITVLYIGSFVLTLAAVATVSPLWTRKRPPIFFSVCALSMFIYLYNLLGIGDFLSHLPVFSLVMPSRIAIVWALALAILAGLGFDSLHARQQSKSPVRLKAVLGISIIASLGMLAMAYRAWHVYEFANYDSADEKLSAWHTLQHHVTFIGGTFIVGLVGVVAVVLARRRAVRSVATGLIVAIVFAQGCFLLRGQNPTVPKAKFMNFPERVERITDAVGHNQVLWADSATLMPDVNLWIPTHSVDNYDVIGIGTYTKLYHAVLRPPGPKMIGGVEIGILTLPYRPVDTRALMVLGVRRVVTAHDYPFVTETYPGDVLVQPSPNDEARVKFRWNGPAPSELILTTSGIPDGAELQVTISGSGIARPTMGHMRIHGSIGVMALPESLPRSGHLAVTVSAADDVPDSVLPGRVLAAKATTTLTEGLHLVGSVDGFQIFKVPGPSGPAFSPSSAIFVSDNSEALKQVMAPDFEPIGEVVLEGTPQSRGIDTGEDRPGRVTMLQHGPDEFSMTVTRGSPGYVVLNQNYFAGWRATVNGESAQILRANSTYMAVPVPSGSSTVTFSYQPTTLRVGAGVSLATAVLLLGAVVFSTIGRRRDFVNMADGNS